MLSNEVPMQVLSNLLHSLLLCLPNIYEGEREGLLLTHVYLQHSIFKVSLWLYETNPRMEPGVIVRKKGAGYLTTFWMCASRCSLY